MESIYKKYCEGHIGSLQIELYIGDPYLKEGLILCIPVLHKLQYEATSDVLLQKK